MTRQKLFCFSASFKAYLKGWLLEEEEKHILRFCDSCRDSWDKGLVSSWSFPYSEETNKSILSLIEMKRKLIWMLGMEGLDDLHKKSIEKYGSDFALIQFRKCYNVCNLPKISTLSQKFILKLRTQMSHLLIYRIYSYSIKWIWIDSINCHPGPQNQS